MYMSLPIAGRLDGHQGVPVVRRGDEHRVDVRPGQQLAIVLVHRTVGVPVSLVDDLLGLLAELAPQVADGGHADIVLSRETAMMPAAHAADADAAHDDLLARAARRPPPPGRCAGTKYGMPRAAPSALPVFNSSRREILLSIGTSSIMIVQLRIAAQSAMHCL